MVYRAVGHARCRRDAASGIRSHFGPTNGVSLALPPREPGRELPAIA